MKDEQQAMVEVKSEFERQKAALVSVADLITAENQVRPLNSKPINPLFCHKSFFFTWPICF